MVPSREKKNEPKWRDQGDGVVGNRRVGSKHEISRETHRDRPEFMAARPEEPPDGSQSVRSSEEMGNDHGAKGRRKMNEGSP